MKNREDEGVLGPHSRAILHGQPVDAYHVVVGEAALQLGLALHGGQRGRAERRPRPKLLHRDALVAEHGRKHGAEGTPAELDFLVILVLVEGDVSPGDGSASHDEKRWVGGVHSRIFVWIDL